MRVLLTDALHAVREWQRPPISGTVLRADQRLVSVWAISAMGVQSSTTAIVPGTSDSGVPPWNPSARVFHCEYPVMPVYAISVISMSIIPDRYVRHCSSSAFPAVRSVGGCLALA